MERKPEWLRVRYNQQAVSEVADLMRDLKLNTVCKAANCPNLGECYQKHTATFMLLGDVCTSRKTWRRRPKGWGFAMSF